MYDIIGIIFPVLRIYGYLQGRYLFGKLTLRYFPTEIYYLLERKLLYEYPPINYSESLWDPQWVYFLLEVNGMCYILVGFIVSILTIGGKLLESEVISLTWINNRRISLLCNFSFVAAIVSLFLTWFFFILLFFFGNWLNWYNIFIDIRGIMFSAFSIFFLVLALYPKRFFKTTGSYKQHNTIQDSKNKPPKKVNQYNENE